MVILLLLDALDITFYDYLLYQVLNWLTGQNFILRLHEMRYSVLWFMEVLYYGEGRWVGRLCRFSKIVINQANNTMITNFYPDILKSWKICPKKR